MLGLPLALLLASAVSAAPAAPEPRTVVGNFIISNFSAYHQFDSMNAFVNFEVSTDFGLDSASCGGENSTTVRRLGTYFGRCSGDDLYIWNLFKDHTSGEWGLGVTWAAEYTYGGTYYFPKSADRFYHDFTHKGVKYEVLVPPSNPFTTPAYQANGPP